MERYIEYICCNPASSHSSSSSTKIFCDGEEHYSPCGCYRSCKSSLFNDHTYAILKRICHKIIKNYSRQHCRENYSIFDGGNSTSIRPLFKRQKDRVDSFCNVMQAQSLFQKNGCRGKKNEDACMPDLKTHLDGKSSDALYEAINKRQDIKSPNLLGDNTFGGESIRFQKGKVREGKNKKNKETEYKNHLDTLINGPKKLTQGKSKIVLYNEKKHKVQGSTDANRKEIKQFSNINGGADYKDEDLTKQSIMPAKSRDTKEQRDKTNKKNKDEPPKIEKKFDQSGINKHGDRFKKFEKVKVMGINQNVPKGSNNERDKQMFDYDGAMNKLVQSGKMIAGSKDNGNYGESYNKMSKKKDAGSFIKPDNVDSKDVYNKNGNSKGIRSALRPFRKHSAKVTSKTSTFVMKGTNKRGHLKSSNTLANRKLYSSKEMIDLPREIHSCRYVRPCDILRVKLEERDLSRCITCFSPYQSYITCRPYQCGLPCG